MTNRTYRHGQVATAIGLGVRRLANWTEQGFLSPRLVLGRRPTGNRRAYRWADIIAAAVLAEVQKLHGSAFRPGRLPQLLIKKLRAPHYRFLETPLPGTLLILHATKGAVRLDVYGGAEHLPEVGLVIDLSQLSARLRKAFDGDR